MSINDFLDFIADHALASILVLAIAPVAALLWGFFHKSGEGKNAPWKYGYAVLVYLAAVPGMFAAVLLAYSLFFTRRDLLSVNAIAYFLPLISMAITLVLIRRRVSFDDVPGFGKLSGLMMMLGASFALALLIDKTRIFFGFFGTIDHLLLLVAGIFVLIKVGSRLAFGRKRRD